MPPLRPADFEKSLEHFFQKWIGDWHHVGDVFGVKHSAVAALAHFGAGNGGGEQAVGDGLRVGVGKIIRLEVVDEGGLEAFVKFGERAVFGFGAHFYFAAVTDAARQRREDFGEAVGGADDVADAMAERRTPLSTPSVLVFGILRPMKFFLQLAGDIVEFERGVAAVPAEDAQRGQIAGLLVEMGKGNFALVAGFFAKGGNEQEVFGIPHGLVGFVGRLPFFHDEVTQDAAQDDDGEFLFFKFDEENAPRLAGGERAELVNLFDFDGVFILQSKFGWLVFKGEVVETACRDRPIEFGFQVADEVGELADVAELVGWHIRISVGRFILMNKKFAPIGVGKMGFDGIESRGESANGGHSEERSRPGKSHIKEFIHQPRILLVHSIEVQEKDRFEFESLYKANAENAHLGLIAQDAPARTGFDVDGIFGEGAGNGLMERGDVRFLRHKDGNGWELSPVDFKNLNDAVAEPRSQLSYVGSVFEQEGRDLLVFRFIVSRGERGRLTNGHGIQVGGNGKETRALPVGT